LAAQIPRQIAANGGNSPWQWVVKSGKCRWSMTASCGKSVAAGCCSLPLQRLRLGSLRASARGWCHTKTQAFDFKKITRNGRQVGRIVNVAADIFAGDVDTVA
jgi:hypothetical protein